MSEEIRRKANSWVTLIYRAFITIGMAVILKSLPMFIYDVARWQKDIEDRTLTSVEMRIDLERHMAVWTPEAQITAFNRLKESETSIRNLQIADSLAKIEREEMHKILSKIEINTRK